MLHLNRYPGQSIILEYGNTLELFYYRYSGGNYEFHIYINYELKWKKIINGINDFIEFTDDGVDFEFKIEDNGKGYLSRKITIWCPKFVHIRRKELEKIA